MQPQLKIAIKIIKKTTISKSKRKRLDNPPHGSQQGGIVNPAECEEALDQKLIDEISKNGLQKDVEKALRRALNELLNETKSLYATRMKIKKIQDHAESLLKGKLPQHVKYRPGAQCEADDSPMVETEIRSCIWKNVGYEDFTTDSGSLETRV